MGRWRVTVTEEVEAVGIVEAVEAFASKVTRVAEKGGGAWALKIQPLDEEAKASCREATGR